MGLSKRFLGRGKATAKANRLMPTTTKRRYREKDLAVADARRIVQGDVLLDNLQRVNEDLAAERQRADDERAAKRAEARKRIGMLAFDVVKRRIAKLYQTA